nr:hypothetical protein [Bacteroidota bacterium]
MSINTNAVVNYNTYHTDITTSDLNTYTTTHNSIAHRVYGYRTQQAQAL